MISNKMRKLLHESLDVAIDQIRDKFPKARIINLDVDYITDEGEDSTVYTIQIVSKEDIHKSAESCKEAQQ